MFSSGGGCCDCGDAEAWRPSGFCSRHPGPPSTSLDTHMCDSLPAALRASTEAMLDALCGAYLHAAVLEAHAALLEEAVGGASIGADMDDLDDAEALAARAKHMLAHADAEYRLSRPMLD